MPGRDNRFGLCRSEVRTPVRHDSIRAVWRVATSAIPDDRVMRYLDWKLSEGAQEWRVWRKPLNTGRHKRALPFCLLASRVEGMSHRFRNLRKQIQWKPDQPDSNQANLPGCQTASPVRGG